MSIYLPQGEEKQEKSVAKMIEEQFTHYDHVSVLAHTEIPKRQLPAIVMMMTLQETLAPLCTIEPQREDYGYDENDPDKEWSQDLYTQSLENYITGKLIKTDDIAMLSHISKKWLFSFGLSMRSVDRKIRLEGVKLGTSQGSAKEAEDNIGLSSKVLQTVGLGRLTKFDKMYIRKGE